MTFHSGTDLLLEVVKCFHDVILSMTWVCGSRGPSGLCDSILRNLREALQAYFSMLVPGFGFLVGVPVSILGA